MVHDALRLTVNIIPFFISYAAALLQQRMTAVYYQWTYKTIVDTKNIVILGGSFAGLEVASRLARSPLTGFKVILVERNSHFNYSFNFPRYSVAQGSEHKAFSPYNAVAQKAPSGFFTRVQDTVTGISETHILLESGEKLEYHYLVVATGSSQSFPAKLVATEHDQACLELRSVQAAIQDSQSIAVVGAGAVGVELATDIKSFYPTKDVTLIHSRGQLLNHFGKQLHDYVTAALDQMKIRVLLNQRPKLPTGQSVGKQQKVTFSDGREEIFDLVIPCTGQQPNSSLLRSLHPDAVSDETSRILVKPTLQVPVDGEASPRIFALGDVAEHGGPRMARAAFFQALVVVKNILALAQGRTPSSTYVPQFGLEDSIKLTLGKAHSVVYMPVQNASDILIARHNENIDLDVKRAWKMYGADIKSAIAPPGRSDAIKAVS